MTTTDASIRAALETHLCALGIATTGACSDIAATATGYQRVTGSFIDDGFLVGDTVQSAGFAHSRTAIILAASAKVLVVDHAMTAEPAGATVRLTATIPERRKFEGQPFLKPKDKPWLRAALRPAGAPLVAWGTGGLLRHNGSFLVELFEPVDSGRGLARIERLAAALRSHFKVGTGITQGAVQVRITGAKRAGIQETLEALNLLVTIDWACETVN